MLTVEKMKDVIRNKLDELDKKYNVQNCIVYFCDFSMYLETLIPAYRSENFESADQFMYNIIDLYNTYLSEGSNGGSTCFSRFAVKKTENGDELITIIYFPEENIRNLIYYIGEYNIDLTDDDIKKYFEFLAAHEYGHILHYNKIVEEKGIKEGINFLKENIQKDNEEYDKWVNNYKGNIDYRYYKELYEKYYALYSEKSANEIVGINIDDYTDLEIKIRTGLYEVGGE